MNWTCTSLAVAPFESFPTSFIVKFATSLIRSFLTSFIVKFATSLNRFSVSLLCGLNVSTVALFVSACSYCITLLITSLILMLDNGA